MSVVYSNKTSKTGKILKQALEDNNYQGQLINWGLPHTKHWREVLNKPAPVRLAANKKQTLEYLDQYMNTLLVHDIYDTKYPIVGRKSYHKDGEGFFICEDSMQAEFAQSHGVTHFQRYLKTCREFRVHVIKDQVIKVNERVGTKTVENNKHSGGKFVYPNGFDKFKQLRKTAIHAVNLLGLDFGCVDILYKDKFYILEINTAPSLTGCWSHVLPRYVEGFTHLTVNPS